jgi:hypothetical protein
LDVACGGVYVDADNLVNQGFPFDLKVVGEFGSEFF